MGAAVLVTTLIASVQLIGNIECPTVATVEQRLAPLLPERDTPAHPFVLTSTADGVQVELRRADGSTAAARVVARRGSCEESAEAVAVLIAAWESQIQTANEPAIALRPPEQPAVVVAQTPPRPSRLAWDVEASVLGSVAGNSFAAGAAGEVYLGRRSFPLGARVGIARTDVRELALGSGRAAWGRVALTLGPTVEVVAKVVRLELHADVLAGWLFMQGRSFMQNFSDNAFDPALGGGARLSVNRWSVTPWVDVSLYGWLIHQSATAMDSGTEVSAEVPRFDVWIRAGIAYGHRK